MKIRLLTISTLCFFLNYKNSNEMKLPLLIPKNNFKPEILNRVYDSTYASSDVIMLRIAKEDKTNNVAKGNVNLEFRVVMLEVGMFASFTLVKDKYFGYFEYKKHIVLVYGDENTEKFFLKTGYRKTFSFLLVKINRNINKPPVSLEPNVLIYHYSDGVFSEVESGMGFFE